MLQRKRKELRKRIHFKVEKYEEKTGHTTEREDPTEAIKEI